MVTLNKKTSFSDYGLELLSCLVARITSLQEEVKHLKHNLERVEGERKDAQDMLNHSEKVNDLTCTNYEIVFTELPKMTRWFYKIAFILNVYVVTFLKVFMFGQLIFGDICVSYLGFGFVLFLFVFTLESIRCLMLTDHHKLLWFWK